MPHLPPDYSIQQVEPVEFWKVTERPMAQVFDENEFILRPADIISEIEQQKLKSLNENFKLAFVSHTLLLHKGELAGWTWGYQDSRESFYMVNSAILPEHRRQGLYKRLLDVTMDRLIEKGFQKIWSRHSMTNNAIIIPKLKRGFIVTGTELSDIFGSLLHLSYLTNETRREILKFRGGSLRPDPALKKVLKI